jgi:SAM-dependent methyltransferase
MTADSSPATSADHPSADRAGAQATDGAPGQAAASAASRLTADVAQAWIDRWDLQQQVHMPDREERFTALIDAVEAVAGRPDPLVLDLGCGPGSLATRLLDRLRGATVIAIDADSVLLALGRAAGVGRAGLRFADQDLRSPGWAAALGLDRPADAVVSTTALHWLAPADLATMFAEAASVLRPGGVLLNGDHLAEDERTAPTLAHLGRALIEAEDHRQFPAGHPESWTGWWTAALADPALASAVADRERRVAGPDHHGSESPLLQSHVSALRSAGFAEIGTLWQRGSNRLLCAVKPEAVKPEAVKGEAVKPDAGQSEADPA